MKGFLDLLHNLVAIWTSALFISHSLRGHREITPKVTGKARVIIALGQSITILVMTKLFGRDASNARKQATILINGSILIAQKANPAPCCQTVTIPSWQARADRLHPQPSVIPAPQSAVPRLRRVCAHTAPRSCTWINSELEMVEEKFSKGRVTSTKKCRCDHSGWLQHMFTTSPLKHLSLLAWSFLIPNRCFILPLTQMTGTRSCGRKRAKLCSEKRLGNGDGGTKSKAQHSWVQTSSLLAVAEEWAMWWQSISVSLAILCLYFHLDSYPRLAMCFLWQDPPSSYELCNFSPKPLLFQESCLQLPWFCLCLVMAQICTFHFVKGHQMRGQEDFEK